MRFDCVGRAFSYMKGTLFAAALKNFIIHSQGTGLPKQWTEGRVIVNPLERLNLRGSIVEKRKTPVNLCYRIISVRCSENVFLM